MLSQVKSYCLLWISLAVTASLFAATAQADWNVGDPYKMHYPQLPDLTPTGLDVLAGQQTPNAGTAFKIVADDFQCTETGPITDVHIWGSWLNDILPQGNPNNVLFKLSIDANIPAPPTGGFSQPGATLWSSTFSTGTFTSRVWSTGQEGFYDPNLHQVIGTDSTDYQYNFENIPNPFVQQQGTIYWLDVQAVPLDTSAFFGWKTTNPQVTPHFMDDSVYADTAGFNGALVAPWTPNVYPSGHPYAGALHGSSLRDHKHYSRARHLRRVRRRRHRPAGLRLAKAKVVAISTLRS